MLSRYRTYFPAATSLSQFHLSAFLPVIRNYSSQLTVAISMKVSYAHADQLR